MDMKFDYVIVQAGGRGSRMEVLTRNKPKALVPVDNLPIIFHLFKRYSDKKFIIIADYKYEVLDRYLHEFASANYKLVRATGHRGTCAGIADALEMIPEDSSFMVIWCDLILSEDFSVFNVNENIIGISKDFSCRWKYEDGLLIEQRSSEHGIAGVFVFKDKSFISDVPVDGEFVRYLQGKQLDFREVKLNNSKEYGVYSEWERLVKMKTRPFNRIEIKDDRLYKIPVDEQGKKLAVKEANWYRKLSENGFKGIPTIFSYMPLSMERIEGKNVYEYYDLPISNKKDILKRIIDCLHEIHMQESVQVDKQSYINAYLTKTYNRLKKVRFLVPFANDKEVNVNGRICRNVFYYKDEIENLVMKYIPENFVLIHGDCTFSNIILNNNEMPILIDPRGYFGNTDLYGDAAYDWVKLYYSIIGNYDRFNLGQFNLYINEKETYFVCDDKGSEVEIAPKSVKLEITSNNWEELEDYFFELLESEVTRRQMKLFLALTWLSLTTYAWEDYDSICGAFYNGLWYLEEALSMISENNKSFADISFESAYPKYFARNMNYINSALMTINRKQMESLICDCSRALSVGHKIIASGLGKNAPVCEKFVGTMLSLGFEAAFLHTNSAVHGDLGMVHNGDLVILLTKSGETAESVYLANILQRRKGICTWLLSFTDNSELVSLIENKLIIHLEKEGDMWDVIPCNSTTLSLIVLQEIAIELGRRFQKKLEEDFKPNHPGGEIGERLRYV